MKQFILLGGDILVFYVALSLMLIVRYSFPISRNNWDQHLIPFSIIGIVMLFIFYINRLYELSHIRINFKSVLTLIQGVSLVFISSIAYFYFVPSIAPKRNLIITLVFFFLLEVPWRKLFGSIISSRNLSQSIVFIGTNKILPRLVRYINRHPEVGYHVRSVAKNEKSIQAISKHVLHSSVCVISTDALSAPFSSLIQKYPSNKIKVVTFRKFYEEIFVRVLLDQSEEAELLGIISASRPLYDFAKRALDIIFGTIGLIIFFVLFIPLVVVIKLTDGGPIFYQQMRIGKDGKKFMILKLRTMRTDAEKHGPQWTLRNDTRITQPGKLLRSLYIDELPQSILLLNGTMSVVGPRPEQPKFVEGLKTSIPLYHLRLSVKPGVTGWAQINQRSPNTVKGVEEKTKFDLYYIKKRSILFDLGIILKTISLVFKHKES